MSNTFDRSQHELTATETYNRYCIKRLFFAKHYSRSRITNTWCTKYRHTDAQKSAACLGSSNFENIKLHRRRHSTFASHELYTLGHPKRSLRWRETFLMAFETAPTPHVSNFWKLFSCKIDCCACYLYLSYTCNFVVFIVHGEQPYTCFIPKCFHTKNSYSFYFSTN